MKSNKEQNIEENQKDQEIIDKLKIIQDVAQQGIIDALDEIEKVQERKLEIENNNKEENLGNASISEGDSKSRISVESTTEDSLKYGKYQSSSDKVSDNESFSLDSKYVKDVIKNTDGTPPAIPVRKDLVKVQGSMNFEDDDSTNLDNSESDSLAESNQLSTSFNNKPASFFHGNIDMDEEIDTISDNDHFDSEEDEIEIFPGNKSSTSGLNTNTESKD